MMSGASPPAWRECATRRAPRVREPASLSTRALDYEGRIADLQQKIRELDESRATLSSQLRALATREELIEHVHHGWVEIFDAIVDPIFMHDRQGRILRANRAYADKAGMDIKEVIGKPYWRVFPLHDGPLASCMLTLSGTTGDDGRRSSSLTRDRFIAAVTSRSAIRRENISPRCT
jgi:PAS domain S-box-containing protein